MLDERYERRIFFLATVRKMSASEIKAHMDLNVSVWTIQRTLLKNPHATFSKLIAAPVLRATHKLNRLIFAERHVPDPTIWTWVVFSDEKKFNLDGPDGFHYFWQDVRKDREVLSKRQSGGGGLMVWGGFSVQGTTDLCFLEGRINSTKYCTVLENYLLPYGHNVMLDNWVFQQDNAPIHVSTKTRNWMEVHDIKLMDWPSKSPDLNPMENMWGLLVRDVYDNGRHQFVRKEDLRQELVAAWGRIPLSKLDGLIASMPKRCMDVIKCGGNKVDY